MASASSLLPLPLSIEHKGAPPIPNKLANAMTMDMIGRQSPSPIKKELPHPLAAQYKGGLQCCKAH